MPEPDHIGHDELLALIEGSSRLERVPAAQVHLRDCASCRADFAAFKQASGLYAQFHEEVLKPQLTPQTWPALRLPKRPSAPLFRWIAILAACLAIAAFVFVCQRHSQSSLFPGNLGSLGSCPTAPQRANSGNLGRPHMDSAGLL